MAQGRFKAAAAQLTSTDDLDANLATCRAVAASAAEQGAQLLVLPECFAFIGRRLSDRMAIAEEVNADRPGPILSCLQELARTHKLWVVAGGMPEPVPDRPEAAYNSCLVLSPGGELVASYQKIHLFDIDIPGRATFKESDATVAGTEPVVVDTDLCRIGLSICYDLRFPELYREMALRRGAELLVVPAAFTAHTGDAHWHTLLRARAIENQCFVLAAAQAGQHNEKRASYGHSLIYDAWGNLIAEIADGTGLAVAEIDLDALREVREQMPCHEHVVL